MQPIDIGIALLAIWVIFLVVMLVSTLFLKAPFVPTPRKVVRKMIELADLNGNEAVYDLGAGDARLLIEAKRMHPNIIAKGYELSFPVYLFGKFRIWLARIQVMFAMKNFLTQDVSDADCVFLYLMPGAMKSLEKKFEKELKKGTKIVSHAFSFPNRTPVKEEMVPWLKGENNLRLYIW